MARLQELSRASARWGYRPGTTIVVARKHGCRPEVAARRRGRRLPTESPRSSVGNAFSGDRATDLMVPSSGTLLLSPPTSLVGREGDAASVCALSRRIGVRLVTLTGPGGVGKTRLARHVAAQLASDYGDGECFVALESVRDPALVPAAIAQALGLREEGAGGLVDRLASFLFDRRILLVLDNFEHVATAAPVVAELLAACPLLKVLATSRGSLRLSGEHEFPVAPLALPDLEYRHEPDALVAYPGVELFVDRARAVRPDFRLSKANAAAVSAICARVDGLPLAIELAATRVALLSPDEILARLARPFELLTSGPRDVPDRQRTLGHTIAWSLALLDGRARTVFKRLGVFAGGFTVGAAEAVVGAHAGVLDALAALVDHGLVQRPAETGPDSRPRLLETIREFALEELAASGEEEQIRATHAAYYAALAGEGDSERLDAEQANLRAALRWYLASEDQDGALALSAALSPFWLSRGHLSEGRRWLEQALALGDGPPTAERAQASIAAGLLAYQQAEYALAVTHCQRGLELCRDRADEAGAGRALAALALARTRAGDRAAAPALAEEAVALYRRLDNEAGVGRSLETLGRVLWVQGDYADARACLEESRAAAHRLGARDVAASASQGLGWVALADGELNRAEALLEESLAEFRELGDRWWMLRGICGLGHVAARRGAHAAARARFEEGLEIASQLGDPMLEAACLEGLAHAHRPADAARLLAAAESLREQAGAAWPAFVHADFACTADRARRALGDERFAAEWARGRAMRTTGTVGLAPPRRPGHPAGLTPREVEVLRLVAAGLTDAQVAERLVLSVRTVHSHVRSIYRKLGVSSRTAAAGYALREGLG
jgi:predicted ATPase/DNA-binding CsgD family transcriptional regulator